MNGLASGSAVDLVLLNRDELFVVLLSGNEERMSEASFSLTGPPTFLKDESG